MALWAKGKDEQADMVKNILPEGVECIFLRQPEQLGLGHTVLCRVKTHPHKSELLRIFSRSICQKLGYSRF